MAFKTLANILGKRWKAIFLKGLIFKGDMTTQTKTMVYKGISIILYLLLNWCKLKIYQITNGLSEWDVIAVFMWKIMLKGFLAKIFD